MLRICRLELPHCTCLIIKDWQVSYACIPVSLMLQAYELVCPLPHSTYNLMQVEAGTLWLGLGGLAIMTILMARNYKAAIIVVRWVCHACTP